MMVSGFLNSFFTLEKEKRERELTPAENLSWN